MWLKLSGELYLFGENAINRVAVNSNDYVSGKKTPYQSRLLNGTKEIDKVEETIEQIEEMLKNVK